MYRHQDQANWIMYNQIMANKRLCIMVAAILDLHFGGREPTIEHTLSHYFIKIYPTTKYIRQRQMLSMVNAYKKLLSAHYQVLC